MIKRIRFTVFAVIISAVLLLPSCIDRLYGFDTDYSTGVLLTPSMIDSIIDAATLEVEEEYPTETNAAGELIVYWLPGGSVWHASPKCSSVERASEGTVGKGSVADAASEGKDRPCKICAKDIVYIPESDSSNTREVTEEKTSVEDETLKYPRDYSEDGTPLVYWTKGGSVWHTSSSCPSLANTPQNNLICGSENEAIAAGKERACKKCS